MPQSSEHKAFGACDCDCVHILLAYQRIGSLAGPESDVRMPALLGWRSGSSGIIQPACPLSYVLDLQWKCEPFATKIVGKNGYADDRISIKIRDARTLVPARIFLKIL